MLTRRIPPPAHTPDPRPAGTTAGEVFHRDTSPRRDAREKAKAILGEGALPALLDEAATLRRNSLLWARHWLRDGMPAEPYEAEHHVIRERLRSFRARAATLPPADIEALGRHLDKVASAYAKDLRIGELS